MDYKSNCEISNSLLFIKVNPDGSHCTQWKLIYDTRDDVAELIMLARTPITPNKILFYLVESVHGISCYKVFSLLLLFLSVDE